MKQWEIIFFTTSLLLIQKFCVGQNIETNYVKLYITEEENYPYNENVKAAKKYYTWLINDQVIKYKTGIYNIKVNNGEQLDSIRFQQVFERTDIIRKSRKPIYDTSVMTILCKFKENHNYKLGQIYPGHFEIYSLDTLETEKYISFKVINNNNSDTLFFLTGINQYKIYSDTTLIISKSNEKFNESFVENIYLINKKREFIRDESLPLENILFQLYFNFIHGENLEIEYNFETKKYNLKMINRPKLFN